LFPAQKVRVRAGLFPVEGAEAASAGADIRVVDIAVNDKGYAVIRVEYGGARLGALPKIQEIGLCKKPQRVFISDAPAAGGLF